MDIFLVLEELKEVETQYRESKEALLAKEDSLHLHADWDALKKEKSITNQRQREAYQGMHPGTPQPCNTVTVTT